MLRELVNREALADSLEGTSLEDGGVGLVKPLP